MTSFSPDAEQKFDDRSYSNGGLFELNIFSLKKFDESYQCEIPSESKYFLMNRCVF